MTPLAVRHAHAKSQAKLRPDGAFDSVALDDPSTQVGLEFAHFFEPLPTSAYLVKMQIAEVEMEAAATREYAGWL
jgi:hypothetical protein